MPLRHSRWDSKDHSMSQSEDCDARSGSRKKLLDGATFIRDRIPATDFQKQDFVGNSQKWLFLVLTELLSRYNI